ncbi:hypothetical protein [Paraburkholderia diazotrophica]|uniref:hypothetical protein n=1 Tax=Paraburkholderia diazotrophica TaxID=667676 RepID=UPI00115FB765|nr:hypothetical protein [Paraburkholderia diazotrophica]
MYEFANAIEAEATTPLLARIAEFERILDGLPQDAIDGGWTARGISAYAKKLETRIAELEARIAANGAEPGTRLLVKPEEVILRVGPGLMVFGDREKVDGVAKLITDGAAPVADSAMAKDAERWRHVYSGPFVFCRVRDDGTLINLGGGYVGKYAIDAAIAASAEKGDKA